MIIVHRLFRRSSDSNKSLELRDLIYYEETKVADSAAWEPVKKRMKKMMHNFVPPNTFRATVRLRQTPGTSSDLPSYHTGYDTDALMEADSPVSFPTTPFSRARVMNRSTERVSSVMFTARDRLRLDELSSSRDELSRSAALEARSRGKYAAFDPQQASEGLALTCGNHCTFKIGDALCCSCRAMMTIRRNVFTYFEFSVTASHDAVPMVSIGVAPQTCPLNVMIGSWVASIGLYSDGQLLAESKWYQSPRHAGGIGAGVTVGLLVFLPVQESPELTDEGWMSEKDLASLPSKPFVQFNVNGRPADFELPEAILRKLTEAEDLFPSVSVLSEGTRVWCRFCEADILYRSRRSIGAPGGVKIYCLDGSKLLDSKSI